MDHSLTRTNSFTPRKVVFAHRPSPSERLETLNSHLDPASGIPLDFTGHKGRVKMSGTRRIEDYDCESRSRVGPREWGVLGERG